MIGINSTFNNSFVNLNIKNNINSSLNSNTNVKNLQDTQDTTKTNNKVLDYEVDKDGFFTSDFNEKAEIPEDIKIHSSTMENFIKAQNNGILQSYTNIDIAKTVGNAYKIVSQLE
ncbi:Cj0814 family flagellar-dependent secreted protein [Campylobacter coli]|uniref:Cj0814 family flagellar-dependent secreted protein n=1 Tax=Campylobacter coli TaxID=195 RepID=UPI003DA183D6